MTDDTQAPAPSPFAPLAAVSAGASAPAPAAPADSGVGEPAPVVAGAPSGLADVGSGNAGNEPAAPAAVVGSVTPPAPEAAPTKLAEVISPLPVQPPLKAPDVTDLQPGRSPPAFPGFVKLADGELSLTPMAQVADEIVTTPKDDEEPASDASSMTILQAGKCLRRGQKVARNGWRTWAAHLEHDGETAIGIGHDGRREPYTPTLEDQTATDWRVVG